MGANPVTGNEIIELAIAGSGIGGADPATGNRVVEIGGLVALNVVLFGAKGDGATDDTAAIQAAITAAGAAGGGLVLLPKGTYAYTTLALNTGNVALRGVGSTATLLKQTANGDGIKVNVGGGTQINNVEISDLLLGASADRASGAALRLGYVGSCVARNVRINNALGGRPYEGIRIDRASDSRFANVRVAGTTSSGCVLQPGSASSVIVEIYFDGLCEFRSGLADGMLVLMDQVYSNGVCSVEGIHSSATYYNNALAGVRLHATVANAAIVNHHYNGATFDSNQGTGTVAGTVDGGLVADASFDATAQIRRLHVCFQGAWSSFNGNVGLYLSKVKDFTICCGEVRSNAKHGIDIQTGVYGRVQVAQIVDNSRGLTDTSYGVQVGGASQDISIATKLENSDTQTQKQRAINLGSTATKVDWSASIFANQAVGTVLDNVNGGNAAGNTGLRVPDPGDVSAVQTAAYAVPPSIGLVRCDTTSAGFTVTLPRAANFPGRRITVKRTAGANAVTIAATAGTVETTSVTTTAVTHASDGTNWIQV
jgi:hypothetical protein